MPRPKRGQGCSRGGLGAEGRQARRGWGVGGSRRGVPGWPGRLAPGPLVVGLRVDLGTVLPAAPGWDALRPMAWVVPASSHAALLKK